MRRSSSLPREPDGVQRDRSRSQGKPAGEDRRGRRTARGRGPPRDGQRRPAAGDDRRRPRRRVLELKSSTKSRSDAIAVSGDGRIAWAIAQGRPQLRQAVDDFAALTARDPRRLQPDLPVCISRTRHSSEAGVAPKRQRKFQAAVEFFQKVRPAVLTCRGCSWPPRATRNRELDQIDGVQRGRGRGDADQAFHRGRSRRFIRDRFSTRAPKRTSRPA